MYNSQDRTRSRQPVGRNVVRLDSQQNGAQYQGNQQQWNEGRQYQHQPAPGGSSYSQQGPGSPSYHQQASGGATYPQKSPGSEASYPQYIDKVKHAQTRYDAEDLEHNKNFGELRNKFGNPSIQQSSGGGVRMNARPGSSSSRKPVFNKPATASELGELGWIPKNKPSPHSQSRYLPASMRSPPVNRKQLGHSDSQDYQSSGVPAWQGTLRSAEGPRAYQVHDQRLQNDQWQNGGGSGSRYEPSREPGDTGEPHSSRYYQLINENNDQMEQFMKLPHHRTAYATGSQPPSSSSYNQAATYDASTGGYGQGASNY